jgi:hypothetical protein
MTQLPATPPTGSLFDAQGQAGVERRGLPRAGVFRDLYHVLRTTTWARLIAVLATFYVGANLVFAFVLWAGGATIVNARPDSFADCFWFSVQTLATIGYGAFAPGDKFVLGISQLALQTLATAPVALPASNPKMAAGLAFQAKFRQADGSFTDVYPIRLSAITDGLSHTTLFSEKSITTFAGLERTNPTAKDSSGWWFTGNLPDALFTAAYPPNAFRKVSIYAVEAVTRGASSMHPQGLHALMGDGSMRRRASE